MKKSFVLVIFLVMVLLFAASIGASAAQAAPGGNSCWGQASAVYARMGEMGKHASQFSPPRVGLRNLARSLYDAGLIPDDSMQSLGVFVADALGLSIDACQ